MDEVKLELLGSPEVTLDGAPIKVDTRKAVALLAYLALSGAERRRDSLAGLLWPEYEEGHARAALRRTLSALNRALGGRGLVVNRSSLGVRPDQLWVDVERFRALLAGCAQHPGQRAATCQACREGVGRAVALYRDDFMAGFALRGCPEFDDWVFFEADALRRELVGALAYLVEAARRVGDVEAAISHARRWLRVDPLHEPAHQELMRLYVAAGRRSDALQHYRDCVALLDRELGVAPLEETTNLYLAIRDERVSARASVAETTPPPLPQASAGPKALPLVGREPELDGLEAAYRATTGTGSFMAVEGEPGVGKTRLVEEFLAATRSEGARVLSVRCHEDERGLAFGVVAEAIREAVSTGEAGWLERVPTVWLNEAARVAPELAERVPGLGSPPSLLHAPGARPRFLEGLAHVLSAPLQGSRPGILFVDDLQWIDESSLDVLAYLAARPRRWPVFLVAAWRSEEPSSRDRLQRLASRGMGRDRPAPVRLSRLDEAAVAELVKASGADEAIAERLYGETEGLPVLVAEYLKALGDGGSEGWSLPAGAREVLVERVGRVSATAGQLLSAAAVLGREFGVDTLRAVSGRREEETVAGIEELLARGLLVESDREGVSYGFSHDKLRSVVYEGATLARRRLLHRRAAEVIGRQRAGGASAALVAHHLLQAGEHAAAADAFRQAGDHARTLYANREALEHYETALGLGHPAVGGLHVAVGDLQTLEGNYGAALDSYEAAAARPEGAEPPVIEHKIALVHQRRGEWDAADGYLESALGSLPDHGAEALRARITVDRSLTAHRAGRSEDARVLGDEALRLARKTSDRRALAEAHNMLGILANSRGDTAGAARHLEQSLEVAQTLGEPAALVAALNNLALTRRRAGEADAARELLGKALKLCISQGDRHREAALHNNLADVMHALGDGEGSMSHLKKAVAIFAEIGEPSDPQPEIWKLFEW